MVPPYIAGVPLTGETLTANPDVGHTIRVRVGALGDYGNAAVWSYATSAPTAPVLR